MLQPTGHIADHQNRRPKGDAGQIIRFYKPQGIILPSNRPSNTRQDVINPKGILTYRLHRNGYLQISHTKPRPEIRCTYIYI